MSEHMKKHLIKNQNLQKRMLYIRHSGKIYAIPIKVAEKYIIKSNKSSKSQHKTIPAEVVFSELEKKLSRPGAMLKGLRTREGLTQIEFAQKIETTQNNISAMENGKRTIGKQIAKRIAKVFKIDYRYFL